ncbi:MAG: FecR domain-containing protein [Sporocytophaga sp.]|uniref:FecR family protein n=1 Tax=Sporocytophaga sp. TaxID=2231183 RepID=UPI001B1C4766|nr:FecR domain-containing protein [Sporocytophaga sp.]MBO9703810.1 FecR domain-containing protein [Sporocytophaga sp.]
MEREHQELILKHLRKESSGFEEQLLSEWLQENPSNRKEFEEYVRTWDFSGRAKVDFEPDVDAAWMKFKAKAGFEPQQIAPQKETKVVKLFDYNIILKAAAVLLVFAGISYLSMKLFSQKEIQEISFAAGNEKREIQLPDSSKVWLNAHSKISYADDFKGDTRKVKLEGEAFFEVKRNVEKPFRVEGLSSITQVLGTSFNVKTIAGQADEVEVVTGKVSFALKKNETKKVILTPGMKGRVDNNSNVVSEKIDNPNFLAWKQEKLVFENSTLGEVASAVEAYFGTKVELANSELVNCRFTGTFEKPKLQEVLDVVSESMSLSSKKDGNGYLLEGSGCQ